MKYLILILSAFTLFSCTAEKMAKRQLKWHYNKMQNIIREFPELADSVNTIEHDTIVLKPQEGSKDFVIVKDSALIDNLLSLYMRDNERLKILNDSLIIFSKDSNNVDSTTLNKFNEEKQRLIKELKANRGKLIKQSCPNQEFSYEDSVLTAKIQIVDGQMKFNYLTKQKKIGYEKTIKQLSLDNTKTVIADFWKDWKFWVLIAIMVGIIILTLYLKR